MKIPQSVIKVAVPILASYYSDSELPELFAEAGYPGSPSGSNRWTICEAWLERLNADPNVDGVAILGKALRAYMDCDTPKPNYDARLREDNRDRIEAALALYGLQYGVGGILSKGHPVRQAVVGGLYFMFFWHKLSKVDRVLDSLVFVGKNLGFDGEPDDRETWYFQDVESYSSRGAYPNHSGGAEQTGDIRLISLEQNDVFGVFDCQRLAVKLLKHADKEDGAVASETLVTRFRVDTVYFMIRYADRDKLLLNPLSLKCAGSNTQCGDEPGVWLFEDISPFARERQSQNTPRRGEIESGSRTRAFNDEDLHQIVDYRGLGLELLECHARRAKAGKPA
jgi:hypothetical protein